jgi:NDP-sugar pyrophosphorylase family protein
LDYDICIGHYALTREGVERYFPESGGFEDEALPRMAGDGVLYSLRLEGEWITVNNLKQLEEAKKKLNQS